MIADVRRRGERENPKATVRIERSENFSKRGYLM